MRRSLPLRPGAAGLLAAVLLPSVAAADLDPTFGPGPTPGVIRVQLQDRYGSDPMAGEVTVHPDGSIFVADLDGVWKYSADGQIDPAFGTSGRLSLDGRLAVDAAVDADGQVLVLGQVRGLGPSVTRLSPDGLIDAGFDGNLPAPSSIPPAAFVEVGPEVVVVSSSPTSASLCLDRLLAADGLPDPSFNGNGHSCVGGMGSITDAWARRNTDGSYTAYGADPTRLRPVEFTATGTATMSAVLIDDPTSTIVDVALPDDATVIVGSQAGDHATVRRLTSGAPDTSFGGGAGQPGLAELADFQLRRLHVLPDGRVLALGATPSGDTQQPQVRLLTADGRPDGALNAGGEVPDRINLPRGSTGQTAITQSTFLDAASAAGGNVILLAGERHVFRGVATASGALARTTALGPPQPLAEPVPGGFLPLTPQRLLDTRPESLIGYSGDKPGAGATVRVQVAGPAPGDAGAVALTVTGTEATGDGFVTVWPCGEERPLASNLNLVTGGTRPNAAIVGVGAGGEVCIFTQRGAHLIVDITGAFSAAGAFEPVTPRRILDTRPDSRAGYTGAKPAEGQVLEIQVAGDAPGLAPEGTAAVVLNLTATETEGGGYVVVEPCALPTATSALNVSAGATTANLVIAPVSDTGTVCLRTQRPAHLLLDLFGWFPADTSYHAIRPVRVLDTRTLGDAPLAAGTTHQLWIGGTWILPSDTTAIVLDVVGVGATAPGYVTVWPCSSPRPATSNLNLDGPDPAASLVLTGIAPGDNVCLFTQNGAHLVVDLFGYTVLR